MEKLNYKTAKPSYVFLKKALKGRNNDNTSFYYHGMNLVYYCIKHDFNEQEVNEYLDKEIQKCKKYLNSNCPCIYHSIPYDIYKDIINTSKDDFKLYLNHNYKYDWKNNKYTNEPDDYYWYEWINKSIRYDSEDNRYKTFFRQCSEHSKALNDLFSSKGYCNCEINLRKYYKDESLDKVFVEFNKDCQCGNENDFKRTCLTYWHFIKLLDYVSEEDKNDIDINELYAKKTTIDHLYDRTQFQNKIKHTETPIKQENKTTVWGLVKGVLTKLYNK